MEGEREGETSATAHKGKNTGREHGLDAYMKAHNVEIGAVATLEKRGQNEIYELEAQKVFALLERAKHTEPLKEAFDECETHLAELEDWLSVFSGKLSTMREDINTIEERNSELETSSRNNGILIETLTELLGELKKPSDLDDAVSTFSLESEEDTAEVIQAVTKLKEYRLQLKGDKLEPYASMRAVREQQEYCTRVSSDIINKTSAHMKSALDDDATNIINKENTMAQMRVDWNSVHERVHERVHKYATLIEALGAVEERTVRLFLRVYCSSMNPLVRHQVSEAVSCVRVACREGNQPLEAFEKLVITCFEALVAETDFMSECFTKSSHGDAARFRCKYAYEMRNFIGGFEQELINAVDMISAVDPLLCVPMLGIIAQTSLSVGDRENDTLAAALLACQSRLQERLFKYLDEHKSDEHGDAADECPVLNEVSFPALLIPKFEESFEAMLDDVKKPALDATYRKLFEFTFSAVERAADDDPERGDVIRIANYALLEENLSAIASHLKGVVKEYVGAAKEARKIACSAYLSSSGFGPALDVATHLHSKLLSGISAAELPFQPGCGPESVASMLHTILSSPEKAVQALHRTMSQHMRYLSPFLFADIWSECTEFIVSWFVFLESVLKRSPEYGETVACLPEGLRDIFTRSNRA